MNLILIKNVEIISEENYKTFNIGIENDCITYIGQEIPEKFTLATILDGYGKIAVPGMVNSHTHAAMTLLRSYADDMVLMDWLENKIWPAEANLTGDDVYWGTMLAIIEMLKSGTTTFADMYFFMDRVAEAVEKTGIRAALARGLIGVTPDADLKLQENVELFKNHNNSADGRIKVMLGPHAPYTCPVDYLKKVIKEADMLGAELHMHLAETKGEVDNCYKEHGLSPIALMDNLGMFEHGTLAAHCVHVNSKDIEIMAQKKVRVAHNPQSNLKLASGLAPIPEMLTNGITISLGTDGASSNNNLDMLEEARLVALLHKNQTGDPLIVPAKEALTMVTKGGAEALGFANLGEIKIGQKADIVLYDMNKPYWYPRHDRTSLFIYAANATDAETVIVNGQILMQNNNLLTIDEEQVYKEANARGLRLISKDRK